VSINLPNDTSPPAVTELGLGPAALGGRAAERATSQERRRVINQAIRSKDASGLTRFVKRQGVTFVGALEV